MLEEPYEVLFEDDYQAGYTQLRYHKSVPCKCPFCGVWSHHSMQRQDNKALVKCSLCGNFFDAIKYQKRAVRRLRSCLKNYSSMYESVP